MTLLDKASTETYLLELTPYKQSAQVKRFSVDALYETPSKTQNYIPTYLSDFFLLVIREYRKDMFTLEKAERKNYYMLNPDTLAYIFHFLHITNFFLSINGVCRQGYPDL